MHDVVAREALPTRGPRVVAWIGTADGAELGWAHARAAALADVRQAAGPGAMLAPASPAEPWPALAILASDVPGRWTLGDAVAVSRRWPLTPIVSVAASLVDGRRRSGPPLPGVDEVPWSELPARLAGWFSALDAGRPGVLGVPATSRREDRVMEAAARLPASSRPLAVSVAARRRIDLDGTAALLEAAGHAVVRQTCGRPPLDEPADALVWDVEALEPEDLAWLGMLAANEPGLAVIVVDSFPRGDTALALVRAGAAAVLGRPLSLEALCGALSGLESRPQAGVGGAGGRG